MCGLSSLWQTGLWPSSPSTVWITWPAVNTDYVIKTVISTELELNLLVS